VAYVYGPVPSRRLGRSLGIDPLPFKTCNQNCVYCQLGRTTPLTDRRSFPASATQVVEEVRLTLESGKAGPLDWLTFVGSGEPTLHAGLGTMIRAVRRFAPVPIAVITNGSLLWRPEVREELSCADAVLTCLDAGTERMYRRIHRPHPDLVFDQLLAGWPDFRRAFGGQFWIDVMLVKDVNDSDQAIEGIARVLARVMPDRIHATVPTRPPAEPWVEPASRERLLYARKLFGEIARSPGSCSHAVQVPFPRDPAVYFSEVIVRHPLCADDLRSWFGAPYQGEFTAALLQLTARGQAQVVRRFGRDFWAGPAARYEGHSPG